MAARLLRTAADKTNQRNLPSKAPAEFATTLESMPQYRATRHSVMPRPSLAPPKTRQRVAARRPLHAAAQNQAAQRRPKVRARVASAEELMAAQLLQQYAPLVRQIVGGFQRKLPRNVLRDDLIAAGMSGLWDAIRRQAGQYDESFEWYVRVRIRGAILDELRAQDWLPRRARAAAAEAQVPGATSLAPPSVVRLDDVSEWEQGRALSSAESSSSESAVHHKLVGEALAKAVDLLPERERHIVSMHYFKGVKFKDLGTQLGVSEPRISQLHSRAMKRLRLLIAQQAA
ncbi:MAG TPA: sigma-70 family RNA polymerase sigma factor [Polyangiaceae bacterium]